MLGLGGVATPQPAVQRETVVIAQDETEREEGPARENVAAGRKQRLGEQVAEGNDHQHRAYCYQRVADPPPDQQHGAGDQLDETPFSSELGQSIHESICDACWQEWIAMSIKVINEYRLHMGEPEHRRVLEEHAARFFRFDGGDGSFDAAGPEGGLFGDPSEEGD